MDYTESSVVLNKKAKERKGERARACDSVERRQCTMVIDNGDKAFCVPCKSFSEFLDVE